MEYIPKRANSLGTIVSLLMLLLSLATLYLSSIIENYRFLLLFITVALFLVSDFILIRYRVIIYRYSIEQYADNRDSANENALQLNLVISRKYGSRAYREYARFNIMMLVDVKKVHEINKSDKLSDYDMKYNYCVTFFPKKYTQLIFDEGKRVLVELETSDEMNNYFEYMMEKIREQID